MKNPRHCMRLRASLLATLFVSALMLAPSWLRAQLGSGDPIDECNSGLVDSQAGVEQTVCLYGDSSQLTAYAEVDDSGPTDGYYAEGVGLEAFLSGGPGWDSGDQCCSGFESVEYSFTPQPNASLILATNYEEDFCYDWSDCFWEYGNHGLSVSVEVPPSIVGYINPKYIVLRVDYVTPGSQSNTQYCSDTSISTTNSLSQTFSSTYQTMLKVTVGSNKLPVVGWFAGSQLTGEYDTKLEQSSKTTDSTTVSDKTSACDYDYGPTNDYQPNSHDYDTIWLWLNPLSLLTFQEDGSGNVLGIQWNGYGFNAQDQNAIDRFPVYAGCLNGHITDCDLTALDRTWDTNTNWPAGQGPGITSAEYPNILAVDPYAGCTALVPPWQECPVTPDPARFTPAYSSDIPYVQPPQGGGGGSTEYSLGYNIANSQSHDYTTSNSTTYGIEREFTAFHDALTITAGASQTYSTTTETDQDLTTSDGYTINAFIHGPACTVVSGVCDPLYPSADYPGPDEFDVYEDTQFGTFLYYPANWKYTHQ